MNDDKRVTIIGLDETTLTDILKSHYPNKIIRQIKDDEDLVISSHHEIILFSSLSHTEEENQIKKLKKIIFEKDLQIKEMEVNTKLAVESIQTFHQQQQALYDEFLLLRQKYDDQKTAHIATLWTYCASYHPELNALPTEETKEFIENETQVGNYSVTEMLGEGQFAIVYSCHKKLLSSSLGGQSSVDHHGNGYSNGNGQSDEYAIKVINKDRITSFSSLRRVSNEISILRALNCPYIIKIVDVIHTKTKLYLITEKGGQDLFEFFDEHPNGVNESWAQEITAGIITGVLYCHLHSICHRDLKPENLLLRFDQNREQLLDIKLCDFGLSTRYTPGELLSDFCGSPGFFAPEMITRGTYLGDKVDIWSIGCILLELILGHERFCDLWMGSYDYEVMQDPKRFGDEIDTSVQQLHTELQFSSSLNTFVMKMLSLDSSTRPSANELCRFEWMREKIGHLPAEFDQRLRAEPTKQYHHLPPSRVSKSPVNPNNMLKAAMSNRERQMIQDHYGKQGNGGSASGGGGASGGGHHKGEVNLPPIEPTTPSVVKVRKIMKQGDQLVKRANTIEANQGQDEKQVGAGDGLMMSNHDDDDDEFGSPI
jgi:serine/threonine protein kinase